MLCIKGFLLACLFFTVHAEDSDITKFMKHLGVIPDVIEEGPGKFLNIAYDSGVNADKGVELTPTQVKDTPQVTWKANEENFYTLSLVDPDAPSRVEPKYREWLHWLVVNIPADKVSSGEVIAEYIGSGPPKGTDLHRYVFLLFKQPKKLEFDEPHLSKNSAKGRANFSIKKFVEKYDLGRPVAGNFYQAQYDDYVPELYKQLTDN